MHAPTTVADLILLGGGGHALVTAEAALAEGHVVAGFLDDDPQAVLGHGHPGIPCVGALEDLAPLQSPRSTPWIIALGDLAHRRALIQRLGRKPPARPALSVCHPSAYVSPTARIGPGTLVAPRAVVHALARIGQHAIINTGAIVEHECQVGENCHIAPGSILGGRVTVGDDTLIGLGARVLPNLAIGRGCVIGAGAMVIRDIPDGAKVMGVPARAPR
jgi:sugar O-acyltransferase (sialic acid O-acetyltransferase NeuD family)